MKALICLFAGFAVACAISQPVSADVTIEMKHNDSSQTLYVAEHALCVEHPQGMMIFHAEKEVLWAVDRENNSYHEITKGDLEKIAGQMDAMKSQMKEAMKNMPAEQRAMAEKMMAGKLPGAMPGEKETTIKSLDTKKEINGFESQGYQVYQEGVLVEEVWTSSPTALGLTSDDFEVFRKFSDFVGTGVPGMEDMMDRFARDFDEPAPDKAPGFPVLTVAKDASGKETDRMELVKVDKGKIEPGRFELPKGLSKQSTGMPQMPSDAKTAPSDSKTDEPVVTKKPGVVKTK